MMRSLPLDRPTLDDPLYAQRNPHQTFLLLLSVLSSVPLLRGQTNSAILERELDDTTVILWGITLLIGSVIALAGSFWPRHTWDALVIERFGLALVGAAALIYSAVVWASASEKGPVAFVVSVTAAYGVSCAWRCWQITRRLRWIHKARAEVMQIQADRAARAEGDVE